jgi:hypothetical protein
VHVALTQSVPARAKFRRCRCASPLVTLFCLILTWILAWTIIFSAIDFWSIKLFQVQEYNWFESYRAGMRYGAAFVSPPSFALAENTYFVWMNLFDPGFKMHEWEWYSGNPANPDGYFNFVWGDGRGHWVRFSMKEWYGRWMIPSTIWLGVITLVFVRRRRRSRLPIAHYTSNPPVASTPEALPTGLKATPP